MRTLTKLYEDQLFNEKSVPVYYRNRADLLQPADMVLPPDVIGGYYFMTDPDNCVSLLIVEQLGKRYTATLSTKGDANDYFISLKDYEHVLDFVGSLKISYEDFVKSNLNPKKVL